MILVSLIKGLIATILIAVAAVSLFFAGSFGLAYLATGDINDSATVSYKIADVGGTGVGIGWAGVPIGLDSARKGSESMKRQACTENFAGSVCQSWMKQQGIKTGKNAVEPKLSTGKSGTN